MAGPGRKPRLSWAGEQEAACDAAEQLGFRAGAGERDADPCRRLGNAPGDLEQARLCSTRVGSGLPA